MNDLRATVSEDCTVYPDSCGFLLHEGETYDIDRLADKGVVIMTAAGYATLPWRSFRWQETPADVELTAPSGLIVEAVR